MPQKLINYKILRFIQPQPYVAYWLKAWFFMRLYRIFLALN
jgi:hypothetical protein